MPSAMCAHLARLGDTNIATGRVVRRCMARRQGAHGDCRERAQDDEAERCLALRGRDEDEPPLAVVGPLRLGLLAGVLRPRRNGGWQLHVHGQHLAENGDAYDAGAHLSKTACMLDLGSVSYTIT